VRRIFNLSLFIVVMLVMPGCARDMQDDSRLKPYEASRFFKDGRTARPLVEGTIARGHLKDDEHLYTGRINGEFAETFPFPITREVLKRGRERYEIYCGVCHSPVGDGEGMVVKRGFPQPTSYHADRLRQSPPGYFYHVITNGFGRMASYADQLEPRDRWAVTAYIRALQFSQNARLSDVPAEKRGEL